jgi:hypothetical protein
MDPTAERVARNDAIFREANERIQAAAAGTNLELVPFICECADERCTQIVPMRLSDYERIRSDPRHFLNLPGHEASAHGWAEVIATGEHHVVVEKIGEAAELVEELDPRGEVTG